MSDNATPTCTITASATDRALARRIVYGPRSDERLALDIAAAIIAVYRAEEVQEAIGHVREVIDAYRREAVARGDRKTIAWIDHCLADAESREEKP